METIDRTGSILMERVIASIGELPTSPTVVSSVMGLTSNLNTGVDTLSQALSTDPALAAKVLRLSNSPFYGCARTVQSLNHAIMILGFSTIRSLVVATSTYSMFKHGHDQILERALWHHSLATAMAARIVAKRLGKRQLIEEFFLGGLLHDIGILVMLQKMPQEFGKILNQETATGRNRDDIELETLGFTHADLGSLVLERWNFPSILSEAVRLHSQPDSATNTPDAADGGGIETLIAHAVSFADAIAHSLGYGFENECEVDLLHLSSTAFLGLTANDIAEISQELGERMAEEQQLFEG